jgi:hypothetical protein
MASGLVLSACGSSSSSPIPAPPSYATIQANLTAAACNSTEQASSWQVRNSVAGEETKCWFGGPDVGGNLTSVAVTASCAYDVSKVAIGYMFSCTVAYPTYDQDSAYTTPTHYQVQLQTPQRGQWWYVADDRTGSGAPGAVHSLSYLKRQH